MLLDCLRFSLDKQRKLIHTFHYSNIVQSTDWLEYGKPALHGSRSCFVMSFCVAGFSMLILYQDFWINVVRETWLRFSLCEFFFLLKDLFWFEGQIWEEGESALPCTGSLLKWLQQPELSQFKLWEPGTSPGSSARVQGPEDIGHPLLSSQASSRELNQKWSSWNINGRHEIVAPLGRQAACRSLLWCLLPKFQDDTGLLKR